jgi:hypothetical protein
MLVLVLLMLVLLATNNRSGNTDAVGCLAKVATESTKLFVHQSSADGSGANWSGPLTNGPDRWQ